jgi:hypothetical protein
VKTIFRVTKKSNYTSVDNGFIDDPRLSMRARGVLLWLLRQPDDTKISLKTIERGSADGRESIRGAMRELEECGYVSRVETRAGGKFQTLFLVKETADGKPSPESRHLTILDNKNTKERSALDLESNVKPSATKKEANPDWQPFVEFFADRWRTKYGVDFVFEPRHFPKLRKVLEVGKSLEAAKKMVTRYLADNDSFLRQKRHDPMFLQINLYTAPAVTPAPALKEGRWW